MTNLQILLLLIFYFVGITSILKVGKLSTYLFYPDWKFDRNLTVEPLIKVKNYVLSWVLTVLFMPLIGGLAFFKNPGFAIEYIRLLINKESRYIILALIYFLSISLIFCALLERILPRKIYKTKKTLILDISIYSIIIIATLVFSLKISL